MVQNASDKLQVRILNEPLPDTYRQRRIRKARRQMDDLKKNGAFVNLEDVGIVELEDRGAKSKDVYAYVGNFKHKGHSGRIVLLWFLGEGWEITLETPTGAEYVATSDTPRDLFTDVQEAWSDYIRTLDGSA